MHATPSRMSSAAMVTPLGSIFLVSMVLRMALHDAGACSRSRACRPAPSGCRWRSERTHSSVASVHISASSMRGSLSRSSAEHLRVHRPHVLLGDHLLQVVDDAARVLELERGVVGQVLEA